MTRLNPKIRHQFIVNAALKVSRKSGGWTTLTRQMIAREADCSEGLISRYLGDMQNARRIIMREAIRREVVEIILQSLVARDGYVIKRDLPERLHKNALISLLGV